MKLLQQNKKHFHYWDIISGMIDQSIDVALNFSQSGHPGGSRSKVPVLVATLLSGVMKWDIRNPGKTFGDRFVLIAGHTNPVVYATLAVFNEALRRKFNKTNDPQYLNPMGDKFTLFWEDLLTLRRRGGLSGHAEMEGKTLFFKYNTGPSGHGAAPSRSAHWRAAPLDPARPGSRFHRCHCRRRHRHHRAGSHLHQRKCRIQRSRTRQR